MTKLLFKLDDQVTLESADTADMRAVLLNMPKSAHDQAVVLHVGKLQQLTAALLAYLWGQPSHATTELAQLVVNALVAWRHGDADGKQMAQMLQAFGAVRAIHDQPAGDA